MTDYLINTERTFTPTDSTLTNYTWKVNGTQEATTKIFKKTFTTLGNQTITLEGSNLCGNCTPQSKVINIVEELPPNNNMLMIAGVGIGIAILYFVTKGK